MIKKTNSPKVQVITNDCSKKRPGELISCKDAEILDKTLKETSNLQRISNDDCLIHIFLMANIFCFMLIFVIFICGFYACMP